MGAIGHCNGRRWQWYHDDRNIHSYLAFRQWETEMSSVLRFFWWKTHKLGIREVNFITTKDCIQIKRLNGWEADGGIKKVNLPTVNVCTKLLSSEPNDWWWRICYPILEIMKKKKHREKTDIQSWMKEITAKGYYLLLKDDFFNENFTGSRKEWQER